MKGEFIGADCVDEVRNENAKLQCFNVGICKRIKND